MSYKRLAKVKAAEIGMKVMSVYILAPHSFDLYRSVRIHSTKSFTVVLTLCIVLYRIQSVGPPGATTRPRKKAGMPIVAAYGTYMAASYLPFAVAPPLAPPLLTRGQKVKYAATPLLT